MMTAREFININTPQPKRDAAAAWLSFGVDMPRWAEKNLPKDATTADLWEKLLEEKNIDGLRWVVTRPEVCAYPDLLAITLKMVKTTPVPGAKKTVDKLFEDDDTASMLYVWEADHIKWIEKDNLKPNSWNRFLERMNRKFINKSPADLAADEAISMPMTWKNICNVERYCREAVQDVMRKGGVPLFIDMHNAMNAVYDAFLDAYRNMGNPFEKETEK
jgi:hypothetical protein